MAKDKKERAVLVTTAHRGVFVGQTADPDTAETITLTKARMVVAKGELEKLLEIGEPLVFRGGLGILRDARRLALEDGRDFNALTVEVQQQYLDIAKGKPNGKR